jgi:hypothetical protein
VRRRKTDAVAEESVPRIDENRSGVPLCWETFFSCQRHSVLRSQLLAALMAGTPVEAARLPNATLLDAVLLATAAREFCDAEIVDDYAALLDRTAEEWARPDWTCRVFSSIHAMWAGFIISHGTRNFDEVSARYIPDMVAWYLRQEVPQYFKKELAA